VSENSLACRLSHYTRPEPLKIKIGPFFGHGLQYQAQAYAAAVDFIEFGPIQPMELSQKEKQALAYVQAHAMAAQAKAVIDPKLIALGEEMTANFVKTLRSMTVECTCAAKSGVIGHAAFCPLGEKADTLEPGDVVEW
jgi:hypothetical protein